ncbi:hypothetical protein G9A89_013738 [Geosiphon pyriformis]|nr:hypothetical protein G9A89_013738 [Geosiphon pyriformis]
MPIKLILDSGFAGSIVTLQLTEPPKSFLSAIMAIMPEFQPHVATSKNPVLNKDPPSNLRKIQPYQPSKLISSCGLMTKKQDYWPYQLGEAKKDPNRTR